MSGYSHDGSINAGRREAELNYPAPTPQKHDEPADSFNTRVNTFNQTRK